MKSTVPGAAPAASASPRRDVASASGNLSLSIKEWGREIGFQAVGIADADLSAAEPRLLEWLGSHGQTYRSQLAEKILPYQEPDGSWWDYPIWDYHKPYGTAFAVMTLLRCR